MKKILMVLMAMVISVGGSSAVASAHGDHGTYPVRKPIVAASSSVVKQPRNFTITASRFCPNKPISISLSKGGRTTTKWSKTNNRGQVTIRFDSENFRTGTYTIRANQPQCEKSAKSWVTIKNKHGHLVGDGSGDDTTAAFAELQAGMDAREAAVASANDLSAVPSLAVSDKSAGLDGARLGLVAVFSAVGLLCVGVRRRRAPRRVIAA